MGWANIAADGVAGFEIEFTNLRWRHIDVVRSWQIVVISGAEKTVAVGQNFQDPFGENMAFLLWVTAGSERTYSGVQMGINVIAEPKVFCSIRYRSIGSDQRQKYPIDDLFNVLRRQRLPQNHELIAHKVERQRRQAGRKLLRGNFAASNPAG